MRIFTWMNQKTVWDICNLTGFSACFQLRAVHGQFGLCNCYVKWIFSCANLFSIATKVLGLVKMLVHRFIASDSFIPHALAILQNSHFYLQRKETHLRSAEYTHGYSLEAKWGAEMLPSKYIKPVLQIQMKDFCLLIKHMKTWGHGRWLMLIIVMRGKFWWNVVRESEQISPVVHAVKYNAGLKKKTYHYINF